MVVGLTIVDQMNWRCDMRYTNYDIIETESGELFLYLSSSYYMLTGNLRMESHARKNIKGAFGKHKKTGNLREWVGEATTPKKTTTTAAALSDMAKVLDSADVSAMYEEGWAAALFEYDVHAKEDGTTIRTPKVKPLEAFFDGT